MSTWHHHFHFHWALLLLLLHFSQIPLFLLGTPASFGGYAIFPSNVPLPHIARHSCHPHWAGQPLPVPFGSSLAHLLSLLCSVLHCILWWRLERTPSLVWNSNLLEEYQGNTLVTWTWAVYRNTVVFSFWLQSFSPRNLKMNKKCREGNMAAVTGDKYCALFRPLSLACSPICVQGFVIDFTCCLTLSSLRINSIPVDASFSPAI